MPLKKVIKGSNMYQDIISHTMNFIKGDCPHNHKDCYCYMNIFPRPKLHLDKREFNENLGYGNVIFIGSSTDMWADNIPDEWIIRVLKYCLQFDNHYVFQTKNPIRFIKLYEHFPFQSSLGTTIETNRQYPQMCNAPLPQERANTMGLITGNKFITIEPIFDFDHIELLKLTSQCKPDYVYIGADSKKNKLPEPSKEKIITLIKEIQNIGIEVKQKANLTRLLK